MNPPKQDPRLTAILKAIQGTGLMVLTDGRDYYTISRATWEAKYKPKTQLP